MRRCVCCPRSLPEAVCGRLDSPKQTSRCTFRGSGAARCDTATQLLITDIRGETGFVALYAPHQQLRDLRERRAHCTYSTENTCNAFIAHAASAGRHAHTSRMRTESSWQSKPRVAVADVGSEVRCCQICRKRSSGPVVQLQRHPEEKKKKEQETQKWCQQVCDASVNQRTLRSSG